MFQVSLSHFQAVHNHTGRQTHKLYALFDHQKLRYKFSVYPK
jgi:hypothetical protein